jgi:hypothetical protein
LEKTLPVRELVLHMYMQASTESVTHLLWEVAMRLKFGAMTALTLLRPCLPVWVCCVLIETQTSFDAV